MPGRAVDTLQESLKLKDALPKSLEGAAGVARGARVARGAKTLLGRAAGTQTESLKGAGQRREEGRGQMHRAGRSRVAPEGVEESLQAARTTRTW